VGSRDSVIVRRRLERVVKEAEELVGPVVGEMRGRRPCCDSERKEASMEFEDDGGCSEAVGGDSREFQVDSSASRLSELDSNLIQNSESKTNRFISSSSSLSFSSFLMFRGFGFLGNDETASSPYSRIRSNLIP
jgi:hypothetical protein